MKTETKVEIEQIKEVISELVKASVKKPEQVTVKHLVVGPVAQLAFRASPDDGGRVIGKEGKHIKALSFIAAELLTRAGYMADLKDCLIYDEKPFRPDATAVAPRGFYIGDRSKAKSKIVRDALADLVEALTAGTPGKQEVKSNELAATVILEVKVSEAAYPLVYGKLLDPTAPYPDGHIIGAIKTMFDGIGKNNGFLTVKIVLSKA